jgi:putative transposase
MGHQLSTSQFSFLNRRSNPLSYGGELRKKKAGRGARPISTKHPIHVVFKVNRVKLRHKSLRSLQSFKLLHVIINKYAKHFGIKVEQFSIQFDHIHLLIRSTRRRPIHHFFRVLAGQIAQTFEKEGMLKSVTDTLQKAGAGLWKHRPFSRIVVGVRGLRIIRNYIQLNEKEARGEIKYQKNRLRGLSSADWQVLWS